MNDFTSYMNTDDLPWSDNRKDLIPPSFSDNSDVRFSKIISGIGIQSGDDEENTEQNEQMLSNVNAGNLSFVQEEVSRLELEKKQQLEKEERERKEARDRFFKERYEKEQEAKKLREEQEAEERARMEAELEARRQANPLRKLAGGIGSMIASTKKKGTERTEEETEENIEETKEELSKEEAVELPKEQQKKNKKRIGFFKASKETEAPDTSKEESSAEEKTEASKETEENKEPDKKEKKAPKKLLKKEKKKKEETTASEEKDWKYIATHDQLTGLGNAHAFDEAKAGYKNGSPALFLIAVEHEDDAVVDLDVIKALAGILSTIPGTAYRIKESGFVVIGTESMPVERAEAFTQRFEKRFQNEKKRVKKLSNTQIATGYYPGGDLNLDDGLKAAIKCMQELEEKRKSGSPKMEIEYDSLLTKDQRVLKETVRENHSVADQETTERILMEIQHRKNEIEMILIASSDFNNLFIIQDVNTFIGMVIEMDNLIDYSYLYVVYEGGAQYYGADEYYANITDIFQRIAETMKGQQVMTEKEITRIPGINIFKNIYIE